MNGGKVGNAIVYYCGDCPFFNRGNYYPPDPRDLKESFCKKKAMLVSKNQRVPEWCPLEKENAE